MCQRLRNFAQKFQFLLNFRVMPNIKRKVDIVSVQVNSLTGGEVPQFTQLLSLNNS